MRVDLLQRRQAVGLSHRNWRQLVRGVGLTMAAVGMAAFAAIPAESDVCSTLSMKMVQSNAEGVRQRCNYRFRRRCRVSMLFERRGASAATGGRDADRPSE